jgi:hypothetical protein
MIKGSFLWVSLADGIRFLFDFVPQFVSLCTSKFVLQFVSQLISNLSIILKSCNGECSTGNFSMGNSLILIITKWSMLAMLLAGIFSMPGMGNENNYDWMGTPVLSGGQSSLKGTDYLDPYLAGRPEWDPYGAGSSPLLGRPEWDPYGATSVGGYGNLYLQLEPADPAREGLSVRGRSSLSNQLYLQRGSELVTEGGALLGEPYVLWAHVAGKGRLQLYDYSHMILNQGYVTPGWYRITGAYADYIGPHLYRFLSAGFPSNNITILVNSGGYPTSLSLTGRVVDQSGLGIPGARVIVSNNEGGTFTTTSGASGYYALDVATGLYLVNAELPGYVFTPATVQVWSGMVSAARPIVGHGIPAASSASPLSQA